MEEDSVVESFNSIKEDLFYIRSVVPSKYVIVYRTDSGYLIIGQDAYFASKIVGKNLIPVEFTKVVGIENDEIVEDAKKIIRAGKKVAVCEYAYDGVIMKDKWLVVGICDTEEEAERICEMKK